MKIYEKISKECCLVNISARKKEDVLKELIQLLKKSPVLDKINDQIILNLLWEREKLGSTGLGHGIAIPHCKIEGLREFVLAVATSEKGVQFDALDNKKVHIFFLMVGPTDKPNEHLQLLSGISHLLREPKIKNELLKAQTAESLYETVVMESSEGIKKPVVAEKQKLLIITLYEQKFLEDILELFIELGIKGSTVIDSIGMGGILTKVPLFADFINFLGQNKNYSKTILAIVSESELSSVVKGMEELLGDLDKRGGASILALDVFLAKGTMEYM
ncbi:MAG: PTS sugar transporter subunit IIA [Candidatus Cloacimonetes bacterium]|nr:PTS sugar transporter subunit IIA [Candidatus Cloacimonadota bacterium]